MTKRTIDGKTVLSIDIEKESRHNGYAGGLSRQLHKKIILDKKWMDKDEVNEKHLMAAITERQPIPVPDIIEIDESIYDKLYPASYKRKNWRIIAEPPSDNSFEYDLDNEDERWLKQQPTAFNLTPRKFETFVEFLEQNSKIKVPPITEFYTYFRCHRPLEALEKVYDYWLEKRLKLVGKRLIPELKKGDTKKPLNVKIKFDPYVAFRPCREKMFLRKNRQLDRENYIKMYRLRKKMSGTVKEWRSFMIQKRVEHEHLAHQFNTYNEQYHKKDFSELYTSDKPIVNTPVLFNNLKPKPHEKTVVDDREDITYESLIKLDFTRNPGHKYHKPIINFIDDDDMYKFHHTVDGLIRTRMGRGGRIVLDRKLSKSSYSPEFQQCNLLGDITIRRYEETPIQCGSTSAFKLSNACNHTFDNVEDLQNQFYFEME